jgi:endo-1,4-beta-xylanase
MKSSLVKRLPWATACQVALILMGLVALARELKADNLIVNSGFESGNTNGWSAFGSSTISTTQEQAHTGAFSLLSSNRSANWNGPSINLKPLLQPGKIYRFSFWVRLQNSSSDNIQMMISQSDGSPSTQYISLDQKQATNQGWVQLSAAFSLNVTGTLNGLYLYFQCPSVATNFYLDDASIELMEVAADAPYYNLLGKVAVGQTYRLTGSVQFDHTTGDVVFMILKKTAGGVPSSTIIDQQKIFSTDGVVELQALYTPNPAEIPSELGFYFQAMQSGITFSARNLEAAAYNWKEEANSRIEQIRKSDAAIQILDAAGNPIAGVTVQARQVGHNFGFGSAVGNGLSGPPLFENTKYTNFFKSNFEWGVFGNESKYWYNEPSQGTVTYETADMMTKFCLDNGIKLRGHCLFWEAANTVQDWVKALKDDQLRAAIDNRLDNAVPHFQGKFLHWDVDNEMLHNSYYSGRLGTSIWTHMHQRARQLDGNPLLFVNEYNTLEGNDTDAYKEMVINLRKSGAPVDGVGTQGHFGSTVDPFMVYRKLSSLATLELPIWITEFDTVNSDENARADNVEALYRTAFSHAAVGGVLYWGFWANDQWRGPDAALVNADWTVNAAGQRLQALMQEWTTNTTGTTDANGRMRFRGFQGNYEIALTLPGGKTLVKSLVLYPSPSETDFRFLIDHASGWTIEAEEFDEQSGVQVEACKEGSNDLTGLKNGSYAVYRQVKLGAGAELFLARVASGTSGGRIEVHLDSLNGLLAGTCEVPATGGGQNWQTVGCLLTSTAGNHDIYLKFTGATGDLFNLNWFALKPQSRKQRIVSNPSQRQR